MMTSGDDGAVMNETEMTEQALNDTDPPPQSPIESPDVGESLPSPEEIRATVNPRPARSGPALLTGKGSGMLIWFFTAMVLVICLSIGLGVGLSNRAEERKFKRNSSEESVRGFAVAKGLSEEDAFGFFDSPQNQAARWMAHEDPLNMGTPSSSLDMDDPEAYPFVLRYTMAVIYYSTGGENWRFQFNFLTDKDTCDWNGVLLSSAGGFLSFGLVCNQKKEAFALYLDNLRLTGEVPNEIKALRTLRILDFNFNDDLAGVFPLGACELVELDSLSIGYNKMGGQLPGCVNRLDELKLLFLSNTEMNGPIPTMSGMVNLQRLFLDDNQFSGDLTTAFDGMPELRFLFLEDNNFTGTVSSSFLRQNQKLVQMDLSDNKLTGSLPVHFFEYSDLQLIDLHGNQLTDNLPDFSLAAVNDDPPLLFLSLHENDLQGPIPASISELKNLFHLDLSSNHLDGAMTEEIGSLVNLTYLFLANNEFLPGGIPDTFASLTKMQEFSVKSTGRESLLPDFISTWSDLVLLDLDDNEFVGAIPDGYGNLVNLQFLLLNDNVLAGDVPQSFSNLVNLRAAFLEGNLLSGDLAHMCSLSTFNELTGDLDGNEVLVADCDGGMISCTCCVCCDPGTNVGEVKACNDHELIANMNPTWESIYKRVEYNFGNDTRFVDRDFLP